MKNPFRRAARGVMLLVIVSFLWPQAVTAQDAPVRVRNNTIHMEMGPGWSGTLNYERTLTPLFNVRLGGGYAFDYAVEETSWELVSMADVTFFKGRHQLIAGVGVMALWEADVCASVCWERKTKWIPTGEIGYRYRARSGFVFRAILARSPNPSTYYTGREDEHYITPAFSFGWSF